MGSRKIEVMCQFCFNYKIVVEDLERWKQSEFEGKEDESAEDNSPRATPGGLRIIPGDNYMC